MHAETVIQIKQSNTSHIQYSTITNLEEETQRVHVQQYTTKKIEGVAYRAAETLATEWTADRRLFIRGGASQNTPLNQLYDLLYVTSTM